MPTCIRMDLSEYQEEPQALIEYASVSLQNAKMIKDTVPADQLSQVEGGMTSRCMPWMDHR